MRLRHRLGATAITFAFAPLFLWVWMVAKGPFLAMFSGGIPAFVLSGRIFTEQFQWVHAGSAMDQPTIGKWLFWFTVMTASYLVWSLALRYAADRSVRGGYWAYGLCCAVAAVLVLCILSLPTVWLIQYISSMGFTPRRAMGLVYAAAGGVVVVASVVWAFKPPLLHVGTGRVCG